jgi:hypothetical protein
MSDPIRLLIEQQEGKTEPSVAITIHVPRRELRAFIAALEKFLLLATTCATTCAGWCE